MLGSECVSAPSLGVDAPPVPVFVVPPPPLPSVHGIPALSSLLPPSAPVLSSPPASRALPPVPDVLSLFSRCPTEVYPFLAPRSSSWILRFCVSPPRLDRSLPLRPNCRQKLFLVLIEVEAGSGQGGN